MPTSLTIDDLLYNVLVTEDLLEFAPIFAKHSIKKVDHLKYATDEELAVSSDITFNYLWKLIHDFGHF